MRRAILRGLLVGTLAASFFGASARGQIADSNRPPIKATPVAEKVDSGPKGASIQPVSGTHQASAHLTMTATNVQMQPCLDSTRTNTRLGLLKNSAAYSHCDFP